MDKALPVYPAARFLYNVIMKKSTIVLDILAALSFIGAYETREFAAHRIGFVRWLNFNGDKLREALPLDTVKYVMLAAAAVLAVIALIRLIRIRSRLKANDMVMAVVMIAALIYYAYATVRFTYTFSPASFLIVPLIALGTLLVTARNLKSPARIAKADEE